MKTNSRPDTSTRPFSLTVERFLKHRPEVVYQAWTEKFDAWFAEPGHLMMTPEVDKPFFFYNRFAWGRHPHYGRFTELQKNRLAEMTWVTGKGGTEGSETVLRVELTPKEQGTALRLTHSGFSDEKAREAHEPAWREALAILDGALNSTSNEL